MTSVMIPVSVMDLVIRVTLLLLAGAGLTALLRRIPASLRHVVWVATLGGALALALATPLVPRVAVPVPWLSAPASAREALVTRAPGTSVAEPLSRLDVPFDRAGVAGGSRPPRAPRRDVTVPPWLVLWLTGALVVLGRFALGRFGLSRLERRARPVTDPAWLTLLGDACVRSGVTRPVRLAVSDRVGAPITWGLGRAVILLPADADPWTATQRRDVLMHELAHVARRDALTLHLSMLACAVYWFHPGVWMAARRLRGESEKACDDRVLADGTPAYDYAALLLSVARSARALRLSGVASIGMARRSTLEGRLLAVLDETAKRGRITARAHAFAVLALAVPLAALAVASPVAKPAPRAPVAAAVVATTPASESTPAPAASAALLAAASPKPADASGLSTTTTGVPEFERSLKASPGERLSLELDAGGEVTVRGWDESRVQVRVKLKGEDWRDETVEIRRESGGVLVASTYPEHHGSHSSSDAYEIRVPRRFDVHLSSAGGPFMATDLDGRLDGHTGGGEVTLKHVTGSAHLATGGGEIRVDDADLSGSVSTGGGAVTLSRVRGGLRGSSGSGPVVYTDSPAGEGTGDLGDADVDEEGHVSHLVETRSGTAGVAHVTRAGGDVTLDEAPGGAVVATGGGDVTVGRSAGLVQASTGGGDIELGPVAGSVEAGTGAGDVHVVLAKSAGDQSVNVTSGSGKVRIDLPRDFDGVLELETAYTEEFGHATTIVTPGSWKVQRESTTRWDDSQGTPRRYVRVSGTVGHGGGRVRVKTVNGDIEVRIAP
ncbi:MAG: M56 family metallopeptidase [Candidatus Eisenbacteria bacterium]